MNNLNNLNNAILKSIRIKNFKTHDDLILEIKSLTDIYGDNRVGKSSIIQAIRVGLFPTKADAEKIKHGKEFCELQVIFTIPENTEYKDMVFNTKITRDGKIYKKDTYNNVLLKKVAKIRESLVSHGTFDPRELLERGNRTAYLLKILPLKITKEELINHLKSINETNTAYEDDEIYKADGFMILKDFEQYIRNIRHSKGLIKEERKKSYEKREKDYQKYYLDYQKKYGNFIEDLKKEKEEFYSKKEIYKLHKSSINKLEMNILKEKEDMTRLNKEVIEVNKEINKLKEKVTEKTIVLREKKSSIDKLEEELKELKTKSSDFEKENLTDESMENRIHWQERLDDQSLQLKTEHKELESALKEWGLLDNYIKKNFKDYKVNKISECLNKIKNLKYEEGQFYYNNSNIEELSESEIIDLGMNIACLNDKGSNFITIDCAEALDNETCEKIGGIAKTHNKKLILIRVANTPLNKEFNSIKIEKKE